MKIEALRSVLLDEEHWLMVEAIPLTTKLVESGNQFRVSEKGAEYVPTIRLWPREEIPAISST